MFVRFGHCIIRGIVNAPVISRLRKTFMHSEGNAFKPCSRGAFNQLGTQFGIDFTPVRDNENTAAARTRAGAPLPERSRTRDHLHDGV